MTKTREQVAHFALWVAALRSGRFKKAEGGLSRETEDGPTFCALGVACEKAGLTRQVQRGGFGEYNNHSGTLPQEVRAWLGIESGIGAIDWPDNLHNRHGRRYRNDTSTDSVPGLNDNLHLSLAQIADVVEHFGLI